MKMTRTKILVCGYYHRHNLGDDAFQVVMPRLFPDAELEFRLVDELHLLSERDLQGYDGLVVGSGDLIQAYFYSNLLPLLKAYRKLERGPVIALGVGLPYPQLIAQGYIDCFDHVFVRSQRDVRAVQKRLGSGYAHYLPDLAFALQGERPAPAPPPISKRVGVFLVQGVASQPAVLPNLVQLFWKLSKHYELIFYRFDSSRKADQDDQFVNTRVQDRLAEMAQAHPRAGRKRRPVLVQNSVLKPERLHAELSRCELAICMRFHAHVFCAQAGVPFLSLADSRKVQQLLIDLDQLTHSCAPTDNPRQMLAVFGKVASDRAQLSEQLRAKSERYAFLLDTRQPFQLLQHSRRPGAEQETLVFAQGQLDLDKESHSLASEFAALLKKHGADHVAELLCWKLTRSPQSAYLHGMREQMRGLSPADTGPLSEMIKWVKLDLIKVHASNSDRLIDLKYVAQDLPSGLHRSGWQYCLDYLALLQNDKGVICDTYLDRSFHWGKAMLLEHGLLPYTSPWIGFLHHTASDYSAYNAQAMIESKEFQQSLPTCQGIVCLSESLAHWLRSRLSVKVFALQHPTEFVSRSLHWSRNRFLGNAQRKLIQVGGWLRNPWTIHTLQSDQLQLFQGKAAVKGKSMDSYFAPEAFVLIRSDGLVHARSSHHPHQPSMCRDDLRGNKWLHYLIEWLTQSGWLQDLPGDFELHFFKQQRPPRALRPLYRQLKRLIRSVDRIEWLGEEAYDQLLAENVVFLDLIDCSACNTLIECIVRNTPIVINRLPAVQEYLGAEYPLYWPTAITLESVTKAHKYLSKLDKSALRVSHFIDELRGTVLKTLE